MSDEAEYFCQQDTVFHRYSSGYQDVFSSNVDTLEKIVLLKRQFPFANESVTMTKLSEFYNLEERWKIFAS
jgi:hypothetical protein